MPDFEARAVHYFQRWSAQEFQPARTNAVAVAVGVAVPLLTWLAVYSYTGDPVPWRSVLLVTLLYAALAPTLVVAGRRAAIRAGWRVARLAEELTYDLRRAASWEFLVNHFRNVHPLVVHTPWFRDILRQAAAQCDRPASHALARWLASLPALEHQTVAPPPDMWFEHQAERLREHALHRLRRIGSQAHLHALAAANRVRSPRIFQSARFTPGQRFGFLCLAAVAALGFWSYITDSRRLNIVFLLALLAGLALASGGAVVRSLKTGVAVGKLGFRIDRQFSPVRFWTIQAVGIGIFVVCVLWIVRLLPLALV